ncbi:uncharacterized protein LOC104903123 isoform X3 [Beta vulgaris subsp. vulgaris]|nr:uncharacterized protein LOC104903123 isoform X3 [Beta vulgaris subsp. vulgaris]
MASVSQKRILNTGTRQISTRNSKIPKFPVSKKIPSASAMTSKHSAAGGESMLKCTGNSQPGARKSLSLTLSSKTKDASSAAKASLDSLPKHNKPSAVVGNVVTNSALPMHSLMSHKAQDTTKIGKYPENNSIQGLLPRGTDRVKPSDGTSSSTAMSHVHSDNAGLSRKTAKVQAVKPSGLRMPSPSLRFFSETKGPVSSTSLQANCAPPDLLKSAIPFPRNSKVADHNHGFKPTQILHGARVDVMGKAGPCSQKTDKCSNSSMVAPKVHAEVLQDTCNQQTVEVQIPLGDENSKALRGEHVRYDNLDECSEHKDQVPTSSKVEDKECNTISSLVEVEETSYKATNLSQYSRTVDRSKFDESCESCQEVQLSAVCETDKVQSRLSEGVEFNISVKNNDIISESQTNLNSHHRALMLASDSNPSSSILDDNRTPGEKISGNSDQTNSQGSMKVQLDERILLSDEKFSIKLDKNDSSVQDSIIDDGVTVICNPNTSVAYGSKHELVDVEQDEMIFDSKLLAMKLSESFEEQGKAVENYDMQLRSSTNSENCDNNVLEVVELSSYCGEGQTQSFRHEVAENSYTARCAVISNYQCTEIKEATYVNVHKQEVNDSKLVVNEMMLQSNDADLICSIVSQDTCYTMNQGIASPRISDDIDQVNNSTEEVKDQIDLLTCLTQTTRLEFQSSGMRSKDQVAIPVANPDMEESLCPVNTHDIAPRDMLMRVTLEEYIESDEPGHNLSPREATMKISQHANSLTDESTCNTEGLDDESAISEQRTHDQKLMRPPPNVVPFSDEWLAAIESAGEEILTLKTGAVKHSPPDKSIPEPGPWSPETRKEKKMSQGKSIGLVGLKEMGLIIEVQYQAQWALLLPLMMMTLRT